MPNSNETHCTGCVNACPIENLSCNKGRALHGLPITSNEKKESLIQKFIRCGKRAERIVNDLDEYGLEEDLVLNSLNGEKQAFLSEILDELEKNWKSSF